MIPKVSLSIFEWLSRVWWPNHGFDERVLETSQEVGEKERIDIRRK
ncbi:MAG: hypothetical protein AB1595_03530 [bacterium]